MSGNRAVAIRATARSAGAIGIVQLHGNVREVLEDLTGREKWTPGTPRLVDFKDIDRGVAVMIDDAHAILMPHGGARIMQRLIEALRELGCEVVEESRVDPHDVFPEAADRFEACMLVMLPRLQSGLGLDLLLDQPRRWRAMNPAMMSIEDLERSARLNRLIEPPLVVLAGSANVGKSTLSNRLLGRSMSIEADVAGTTRDYTTASINLAGLVVRWIDTPGLRAAADSIEQEAVRIARPMIDQADFLIAMTDHEQPWPELPREPDLFVQNKCDIAITQRGDALHISATTGEGIEHLVTTIRQRLVSDADLAHRGPWIVQPPAGACLPWSESSSAP